jgi:arginine exporter protein ArgO
MALGGLVVILEVAMVTFKSHATKSLSSFKEAEKKKIFKNRQYGASITSQFNPDVYRDCYYSNDA